MEVLSVIESYTDGRIQEVVLPKVKSDSIDLYRNVLQSPLMGPFLFKIYVNRFQCGIETPAILV